MAVYEIGTIKGTVKTFISDERGEFGFIVPDDGSRDVFVHATTIWEHDISITPKSGDRMEVNFHTVDEGKNKGGRRATEVLAYEVVEAPEAKTGHLKWFKAEKGYGFVKPDEGGDDLFIHRSVIEQILGEKAEAPVGAALEFQIGPDHQGRLQVTWFRVTEAAPAEASSQTRFKKSRKGKSRKQRHRPKQAVAAE